MNEQDLIGPLQAFVGVAIRHAAIWTRREFFLVGAVLLSIILFRNRRRIASIFILLLGFAWMAFHDSISEYFHSLGSDSFAEAGDFDWHEAAFWFTTLREVVAPDWKVENFLPPIGTALAIFWILQGAARRYSWHSGRPHGLSLAVASLAMSVAVIRLTGVTAGFYLTNSNAFASLQKNFDNHAPGISTPVNDLKVVLYIGESTSSMNMSVYGYGRDTTPHLKRLQAETDSLLLFQNVFSTHTHTSFSLLEAFSFAVDAREDYLPISARRRLSVVDVLQKNGIPTALISNQGKTGTWNQASAIVFKNATRTFSIRSEMAGSMDVFMKRPWDHDFFLQQLQPSGKGLVLPAQVTFLHSYAGHGKYFENIPPAYRVPVDSQYLTVAPALLFGPSGNYLADVEQYDAAVRYIDDVLHRVTELVRQSAQPIVLVYFSDHGDAVYTGRGHESSRYVHEMARVPFLMYFNDAARRGYAELFHKYSMLARSANSATLAQIPSTLLDLVGARIEPRDAGSIIPTAVVGEKTVHPPILVRKIPGGIEYFTIDRAGSVPVAHPGQKVFEGKDHASKVYALTRNKSGRMSRACYEHAETLGSALRGSLVADCLQIDWPEGGPHRPDSGSAPVPITPILPKILKVAADHRMDLWLRLPNSLVSAASMAPAQCETLVRSVGALKAGLKSVMVEFPSAATTDSGNLRNCMDALAKAGMVLSYQVPSEPAQACAKALAQGTSFEKNQACLSLSKQLAAVRESRLFTDIVFEYPSIQAIENADRDRYFSWNLVRARTGEYFNISPERFRMVALEGADPNSPRRTSSTPNGSAY